MGAGRKRGLSLGRINIKGLIIIEINYFVSYLNECYLLEKWRIGTVGQMEEIFMAGLYHQIWLTNQDFNNNLPNLTMTSTTLKNIRSCMTRLGSSLSAKGVKYLQIRRQRN